MLPSWPFVDDSQRNLDRNSASYEYLKKCGIVLDKKDYKMLKKLSLQYALPTKNDGWKMKFNIDPFLYDKLAYANSPLLTQQMLGFVDDIGSGSRVLDVGCGFGYKTSYMLFNDAKVLGTDFSPDALRILSRKAKHMSKGVDLVMGDFNKSCLSGGGFDYIVASQIFNRSYTDTENVLREHLHLLKNGGEVYVSDYMNINLNSANIPVHESERVSIMPPSLEDELEHSFRENEAMKALKKLGFEARVIEGDFVPTVKPSQSLKPYLIKAKRI